VITSPDATLSAQDARARLSARRFTLLGASATVLPAGVLRDRRDRTAPRPARAGRSAAFGAGATRGPYGCSRRSRRRSRFLVGTPARLLLGGIVGAVTAAQAGLSAWSTAATAVGEALPGVLLGAALAIVVVAVTSSWTGSADRTAGAWSTRPSRRARCCRAVRGPRHRRAAALDAGTDPLLAALPVLVVLCGGLLAARLCRPRSPCSAGSCRTAG